MGRLRLRHECEYCGRHFNRKNKRALSVSFNKRPKKHNKCEKCNRKMRLGLLVEAKREFASGNNSFRFTPHSASSHSIRPTHTADVVSQTFQDVLHCTDGSNFTVNDNQPPHVGPSPSCQLGDGGAIKERQEAKPKRTCEVSSKNRKPRKFRCPVCHNVAIQRKHDFIGHLRSHYRNRSLLRPTAKKYKSDVRHNTGNGIRPEHTAHSGTMEQVVDALDEDSFDPPKIKEIAFHKAVLLTATLWAEYVKNWQSIRSHQHIGVNQNLYNFRLTSMNLHDLFPLLRCVFANQPGSFKFNIGFAFILRHRTSGVHRYCHANDDTMRFFETPMPVQSTADFGEVLKALAVQNLYQWTFSKRIRSSWHVTIITNATAVVSREQ